MTGPNLAGTSDDLSDDELFERLLEAGLSEDDAALHVERRTRARTEQGKSAGEKANVAGEIDPFTAAVLGAYQGSTSGFGDELAGLTSSDPQAMREAGRATISAARKQHPWASLGGEVAGSFANPALRGVAALSKLKLARPAAQAAVVGGAAGGLTGLGEPEGTLSERAPAAAVGTALGGAGGAVGGKVLEKARRFFRLKPQVPTAAPATSSGTSDEAAVAKVLKLPVEKLKGRVGEEAVRRNSPLAAAKQAVAGDRLQRIPTSNRTTGTPAATSSSPGSKEDIVNRMVAKMGGGKKPPTTPVKAAGNPLVGILRRAKAEVETATRVQPGATKGQLAHRSGSISRGLTEKVQGMSDDELRRAIEQTTKRNDQTAPLYADILARELARRVGG